MPKKRRTEISLLNVLFCLLVIFIHCISYPVSAFLPGSLSYTAVMLPWRMTSFVVPGFILLAGVKLFLTGKDTLPFSRYIKGRLRGVLLPYAVAFAVYYLVFAVFYDYPIDILFISKNFILGSLVYHLYFIPILMQFDLLFPLWKRLLKNCSPLLVIPFALLISGIFEMQFPSLLKGVFPDAEFLYNDRLFTTYLGYWLIGCYAGKYYGEFSEILQKNFRFITAVFLSLFCVTAYYSYLAYNGISAVPALGWIHNLYVLSAILFLYAWSLKKGAGIFEKIPLSSRLDSASFYIYLYHVLVLLGVDMLLGKLGIFAQGLSFLVRTVLVYTITPALCIAYVALKKKLQNIDICRNLWYHKN